MADRQLSVVIVDDEPPARSLLRLLCVEAGVDVLGEAEDGASAMALLQGLSPDAILLDIAMPGMSGMDVARQLRERAGGPPIIFTTAYTEYAVGAFDVGAVDYLLKPIDPARLKVAFERAHATLSSRPTASDNHIWVPTRTDLQRVELGAIDRIEAERDYVRLHLGTRSYLFRATMDAFEKRLLEGKYLRVHRSTILRKDTIASLKHEGGGTWAAVTVDGATVRIGRSYLEAVRKM
jgi:DNA-binding LytR/AlgR family response regulator